MFSRAKKGQIAIPPALLATLGILFVLFLAGILVYSFALAGGEMLNATDDAVAQDVINQTLEGASSYANFSPVLWIMAAIATLLVIVLIAFGVVLFRRQ